MNSWKRWLSAMLACLMIFGTYLPLYADDLENQLSDVQSKMQAAQRKKELAEMEIGSVSEVLRQIQVQLDQALAELRAVEEKLSAVNAKIKQTEAELKAAEKRLHDRENVLHKRLRDIYMHGKLNYLEVIMGAKSFTDFANRLEFLKRIISSDLDLIVQIKKEREIILAKKQELEKQRQALAELQKEAAAKKNAIEEKKQEQLIVLGRLQNERDLAQRSYQELEAASQDIENRIRARENQGISAGQAVHGTGQFMWPVTGPITSPFGYRIHPIFGTRIYHSGIDIGVDTGTPVHAADSGVIMEADWVSGYGYTVIIDHGNGLITLYGHNSQLLVSAGQAVQKGQVVAYSGSTGYSTGPHVHFEVRKNGTPVQPLDYL